jgi:hypothetical protein
MTVSLSGAGVAEITATPSSLAFGNVARGSGASLNVTLQNNLATSLTSVALTTAAPYSAAGCSGSVAPGGSCVITVTFAPTTQSGVVNSSLTITAPPASTPATVALTGTAVVPLTVSPNPLDFGNVAVTVTSAPKSVTLANNTGAQVTLGTPVATLGGDAKNDYAVTSTTCGKKLNVGATCAVSVTFHPTIGGSRAATLLINNSALATPQAANLIGTGTNPLTVSPALNLGSVDVASTSTSQTASVKNNQTVAVIFSSITAGADFAVQPAGTTCSTATPLAAGATCVIAVVMTPTIGGPRAGLLTIVSDAYGSPNTTTLSGVGTNPVVATPSTLSFGNVTVASTSAGQTVTVTNRQSVAATLQAAPFTFTGTAAADYGVTSTTCPAPPAALAAGANCTATIAFTPRVGGARSASLSVNDTAFGNPRAREPDRRRYDPDHDHSEPGPLRRSGCRPRERAAADHAQEQSERSGQLLLRGAVGRLRALRSGDHLRHGAGGNRAVRDCGHDASDHRRSAHGNVDHQQRHIRDAEHGWSRGQRHQWRHGLDDVADVRESGRQYHQRAADRSH